MSENKGDLISRGRLIDICKQIASDDWNQRTSPPSWSDAYDSFAEELEDAPAVDAQPVVHGRWVSVPSSDMSTGKAYVCSECRKMRYGAHLPNYCPNCGAKMDGGAK